jgi:hypothetical protein
MIDECPGPGKCHGPRVWCDNCGNVGHICDTRLRDERCDAHPVPPTPGEIAARRKAAEAKLAEGRRIIAEGEAELMQVREDARARQAYGEQLDALKRELFCLHPRAAAGPSRAEE